MARRKLNPITFRGIGLTTNGRTAYLEYDEGGYDSPRHSAVAVSKQGIFPSFLRLQPESKTFPLHIVIKSPAKQEQFDQIAKIFDPTLGAGDLILEDISCSPPQQFRVSCAPQQIIFDQKADSSIIVSLFAADPVLEEVGETVQTDNIDTAGPVNPVVFTIRNIGNMASDRLALRALPETIKLNTQGFDTVYEVAYANRSEFSLTGPGNGTWLINVAPASWDTTGAGFQAGGTDIAVFVDEIELPPEKVNVEDFGTADTKVWIEIADGPAQFGELAIAIAASGGVQNFTFQRADHGFRAGDYLVWGPVPGSVEQGRVESVSGTVVSVRREMRNTSAITRAIGDRIYRSGHHIQLAHDFTARTTARPTNPDPPLIDLTLSTNLKWEWLTAPMWPNDLIANRRPGGWRRILYNGREDIPQLRKNRLSAFTTLVNFGAAATFQDEEPSVLKPNYDAIEFIACCGIADTADSIEYDCALDWPFAFQIIGRDLLGYDNVIALKLGHESGAAHFPPRLYVDENETPDGVLSALIFRARNIILTSVRASDAMEEDLAVAGAIGHDLQTFTIDEEAQLLGIVLRARDVNVTADGMDVQINTTDTGSLLQGGERLIGPFSGGGSLGAVFRPVCFFPSAAAAFTTDIPVLAPGQYFISMVESTPTTADIRVPKSDGSIYTGGEHWERTSSRFAKVIDEDLWFAILSINADNQEETLQQAHSGEFVVLDNFEIEFDLDRTPIVQPAAAEDAYYFDTTWEMNGDTIRLRWLRRRSDMLGIDAVVINPYNQEIFEDKFGDNIRAAVEISSDPWLEAQPGDNTLTITAEIAAEQERHIVAINSTWLA